MGADHRAVDIAEATLSELACRCREPSYIRTLTAFDRGWGLRLLIDEGWDGYKRVHRALAHIEVRETTTPIHEGGTEEGIANALVSADIPRDRNPLAFRAPSLRASTDFTVA